MYGTGSRTECNISSARYSVYRLL